MSFNRSLSNCIFSCLLFVAFAQPVVAANARFRSIEVPIEYGQLLIRSVGQNEAGYILLGTDSGLFQYDGFQIKPFVLNHNNQQRLADVAVNDLLSDSEGVLWLATRGSGLFRYETGELVHFGIDADQQLNADFISEISADAEDNLWLATDTGLHRIDGDFKATHFGGIEFDDDRWLFMTALLPLTDSEMLIGTKGGLLLFNHNNHQFTQVELFQGNDTTVIYALHKDQQGGIWVGSDDGVFYRPVNSDDFVPFKPELISYKVLSITSKGNDLWIGTISNGLFHYSYDTHKIQNFSYQQQNRDSLSDNTILDLFVDSSGVLWVSTFYQGLSSLDIQSLHFGLENDANGSVSCAQNLLFSGFAEDEAGFLWLANGTDLIKYNPADHVCQKFAFNQGSETIKSVLIDTNKQIWVATTQGLYQFDHSKSMFLPLSLEHEQLLSHFVMEQAPGVFLLGTNQGLFRYFQKQNQLIGIPNNLPSDPRVDIYSAALSAEGVVYFATSVGLMYYMDGHLLLAENMQRSIPTDEILQVFFDSTGHLWVGTDGHGAFAFNQREQLVFQESHFGDARQDSISSIIEAANGDVWMGTIDSGLIRVTAHNKTFKVFYPSDGLQGMSFNINAAYRSRDGRLYMGGRNGFNAFDPEFIAANKQPPKLALTDLMRFGEPVPVVDAGYGLHQQQEGLVLTAPINELHEITINHLDYVIGFEFAVLDYSDPMRNQYAFQMEGLDPNWNYVDAENRRISYTNLQAGDYVFRVKGANKHGIWNNEGKAIKLTVLPAPWLTWWAISSYGIVFLLLLFWWASRRTRINRQINQRLVTEVEKKTQALQAEKQTVEALLATKNQLFANVSHEFRTPLTLILGPVKRLLESPLNTDQQQTASTIKRNANRLLTMIEQLLQLAKMSGKHSVEYHNTETHLAIDALVHAFQPLACNKRIQLKLLQNDKAMVQLSQDALEVIVSNLLSNAIKYTPEGGQVEVESCLQDCSLCIRVKDTGAGLDEKQQLSVFERFKRLEKDQNIEGIGIGLSVVKELVELNKGTILVDSKLGQGSCFTVTFGCTESSGEPSDEKSEVLLVRQLSQIEEQSRHEVLLAEWDDNDNNEKILIIDDNADMRNHIAKSLNNHYHCMLAKGGKEGIALAIQYVPDVVICDVMMPEVDGFHVSRVLRSDSRTSHIPLVMLTALNDKESRVRGWREHVDVYLTKPFDASELLLQLENVMVIRSILNKKAAASVKQGQDAGFIDLPKKDQKFINKLNQLIEKNYQLPNYSRQQMASAMAVSERQLQRKLKALIDQNPLDLLREYRLSQAAIMLKDGYQVSITSDSCGFNSLPHFSKCFKSQYGLSPKAYQMACKSLS